MKKSGSLRWVAVVVVAAAGAMTLPAQIQTNVPAPKPPPKWETTLKADLVLTRGNSQTMIASGAANTQKKWDQNELKFNIDGTYGEAKDQDTGENTINANSIHGSAQYNRLFTERLYGYGRIDALHDDIADLAYRVTASPGAGYYLIKKPSTDLSVEIGPGYVWQKQGGEIDNYPALRFGDNFTHKLNDRAKIWQKTEVLPKVEDFAYIIVNSEIGVSAALTEDKKFSLVVTLFHTYNSRPAEDRLHNDTILKAGISYTF
jgi:putative salt-induced outer membrane protein